MGKSNKKPSEKRAPQRMEAPIWLDAEDKKTLLAMQQALMTRTAQAAMWDAIRWVHRRLQASPTAYKKFMRESDKAFSEGEALTLRLTEEQRQLVAEIEGVMHTPSRTEAYRLVIRMAGDWYINNPVKTEE